MAFFVNFDKVRENILHYSYNKRLLSDKFLKFFFKFFLMCV